MILLQTDIYRGIKSYIWDCSSLLSGRLHLRNSSKATGVKFLCWERKNQERYSPKEYGVKLCFVWASTLSQQFNDCSVLIHVDFGFQQNICWNWHLGQTSIYNTKYFTIYQWTHLQYKIIYHIQVHPSTIQNNIHVYVHDIHKYTHIPYNTVYNNIQYPTERKFSFEF